MRIAVYGRRGPAVGAKDVILAIIATIGTGGGVGHAIEYAGAAIRAMSVTERLTACNMSIEVGARYCMVAPDEGDVRLAARPSVHADRPSSRRTVTGGTGHAVNLFGLVKIDPVPADPAAMLDTGVKRQQRA